METSKHVRGFSFFFRAMQREWKRGMRRDADRSRMECEWTEAEGGWNGKEVQGG